MNEVLTVLVVEDNPAEADLILEMLPETGPVRFKVESVSRLSGALGRLEGGGIDVVLLDLGLPDSQGLDTVLAVKGTAPHVPIVVLTGHDDEATGQAAVWHGAQDYLVKGTMPERMLARILRFAVERHRVTEALRQSEETYRLLFETMAQGVALRGADGRILSANPAALAIFGLSSEEILGQAELDPRWRAIREDGTKLPSEEHPCMIALQTGQEVNGVVMGVYNPRQEGWRWLNVNAVPLFRQRESKPYQVHSTFEDITERKREELARSASLERQERINQLQQALLAPGQMEQKLKMITDGVVDIFAADFCRIWRIAPGDLCELGCMHATTAEGPHVCHNRDRCLRLIASSGRYTRTEGAGHGRVPFGVYKIGLVASGQEHRFLTNDVTHDPRVHDHEWARELGLVSFAGYQLRPSDGETLGVLALFRKHAITAEEDAQLDALSGAAARVIRAAQAELVLQRSERKYRNLHESMRDGFVCVDMAGRIKEFNESFQQMVGYSNEELPQLTFLDLTPEHWHAFEQSIVKDQILLRGYSEVYEKEYRRKDGTVFPVELRTFLIEDGNGGNREMWAIVRDITERKQAEDALRKNEALLNEVGQIAKIGGWEMDLITRKASWTLGTYDIVEIAPGEPIPGPDEHMSYYLPEYRSLVAEAMQALIEEGKPLSFEAPLLTAKGNVKWCHAIGKAFREGDKCINVHGTFQDITERKRAEEVLKQAEEKYRSIFDNAVEGIFQATPEGRYLSVNPALARMCGFENPEEMMTAITDIATQLYVDMEDRTKIKALYEGVGVVKNFETQYRRTDGRLIWVSINARTVRDGDENILYYEGTLEDITERKQAEEDRTRVEAQLRQAQKMEALGTLAGGIAHDFNNILGIIVGYSEMAQLEADDGSRVRKNLQAVLTASYRAKDLVQQILAFSRRGAEERKSVQVGMIVKEVLKMLRASLPSSVEIKMNVTSEAIVFADPTQIHQVLMNLCTNAAHAMRDHGGVLEVSLTDILPPESIPRHSDLPPGPYVKLTVKDTGHGIDRVVLDRIFDPFFTTKEKGVGTGLGLSVVDGIVKNHGGIIEVESHPGEGATFQVFFPAMDSTPGPQTSETVPLPRGRERILFVDDELDLALVKKQMLESLGYDVDYRTNGIEALDAFRHQPKEKPFDLVITDMTMPHLTGDDLARELLRQQPNLPIILCTGFSEKMDAEKARTLGIQGFLTKPVVMRELAETVRRVLDKEGKST